MICWGGVGHIPLSSAGMPEEALPQGQRKGKLSYTIVSPVTNAKIEVLLKGKAFRIVKTGELQGDLSHFCSFVVSVFIYFKNRATAPNYQIANG